MSNKPAAVFGLYKTRARVEIAVERMRAADFESSEISVLFPAGEGSRDFTRAKRATAPEAGSGAVGGVGRSPKDSGSGTSAPYGAVGLGWLAGIRAFAVPGLGSFVAAGPLIAALGAAGQGGIARALTGLGLPQPEARHYQVRVRQGWVLLSIQCGDPEHVARARSMLKETGADEIAYPSEPAERLRGGGPVGGG